MHHLPCMLLQLQRTHIIVNQVTRPPSHHAITASNLRMAYIRMRLLLSCHSQCNTLSSFHSQWNPVILKTAVLNAGIDKMETGSQRDQSGLLGMIWNPRTDTLQFLQKALSFLLKWRVPRFRSSVHFIHIWSSRFHPSDPLSSESIHFILVQ